MTYYTYTDGAFVHDGLFVRGLGTNPFAIDRNVPMGWRVNLFGTRPYYRGTTDAGIRAEIRALYHARCYFYGTLQDVIDIIRDIQAELPDDVTVAVAEPSTWALDYEGVPLARQRGEACYELANVRRRWLTTRHRPTFVLGINEEHVEAFPVLSGSHHRFLLTLKLPFFTPTTSDYERTIPREIARVWCYA